MEMIRYIIFFCIIIIILQFFFYKKTHNLLTTSKCWIDNNKFPQAQILFDSRDIIKKELFSILNSDKWSIWSSDYETTPIFTKMTHNDILTRLHLNAGNINSSVNSASTSASASASASAWRIFGLVLNKKILPTAKYCPNTIKLLKSINFSQILNAGFSLLEPNYTIGSHQDFDNRFYRLHIPLIIPDVNSSIPSSFVTKKESKKLCTLQVENDYKIWKNDEYFIFDDTCKHNAWNPTNQIRIVLLIDLLK
jgi:hypothetical protein